MQEFDLHTLDLSKSHLKYRNAGRIPAKRFASLSYLRTCENKDWL